MLLGILDALSPCLRRWRPQDATRLSRIFVSCGTPPLRSRTYFSGASVNRSDSLCRFDIGVNRPLYHLSALSQARCEHTIARHSLKSAFRLVMVCVFQPWLASHRWGQGLSPTIPSLRYTAILMYYFDTPNKGSGMNIITLVIYCTPWISGSLRVRTELFNLDESQP